MPENGGRVPAGICLKNNTPAPSLDVIEGIRTQPVDEAILSSQHILEFPHLLDAVESARRAGLLDEPRAQRTIRDLYKND